VSVFKLANAGPSVRTAVPERRPQALARKVSVAPRVPKVSKQAASAITVAAAVAVPKGDAGQGWETF